VGPMKHVLDGGRQFTTWEGALMRGHCIFHLLPQANVPAQNTWQMNANCDVDFCQITLDFRSW